MTAVFIIGLLTMYGVQAMCHLNEDSDELHTQQVHDIEEPLLSFPVYEPVAPQMRRKRQVIGDVQHTASGGSFATLGAKGTLFNDKGHRLDGQGQMGRNFNPSGRINIGAGLNYVGPKLGGNLDVNHARHQGTNVNAGASYNLFQSRDRRTRLDATANYRQQFGPRSRLPDYGGGLQFKRDF